MYNNIYDIRKNKYISINTEEGKQLINKYKNIYCNLNNEGKKEISKLFKIPKNLLLTENTQSSHLYCKTCSYMNVDKNSIFCCKCGKSLH